MDGILFSDNKFKIIPMNIGMLTLFKLYNAILEGTNSQTLLMLFVQNFFLRMTTLVALLMVGYLEMIKHRNNYPSFKQPQYNRIIEYLE